MARRYKTAKQSGDYSQWCEIVGLNEFDDGCETVYVLAKDKDDSSISLLVYDQKTGKNLHGQILDYYLWDFLEK